MCDIKDVSPWTGLELRCPEPGEKPSQIAGAWNKAVHCGRVTEQISRGLNVIRSLGLDIQICDQDDAGFECYLGISWGDMWWLCLSQRMIFHPLHTVTWTCVLRGGVLLRDHTHQDRKVSSQDTRMKTCEANKARKINKYALTWNDSCTNFIFL